MSPSRSWSRSTTATGPTTSGGRSAARSTTRPCGRTRWSSSGTGRSATSSPTAWTELRRDSPVPVTFVPLPQQPRPGARPRPRAGRELVRRGRPDGRRRRGDAAPVRGGTPADRGRRHRRGRACSSSWPTPTTSSGSGSRPPIPARSSATRGCTTRSTTPPWSTGGSAVLAAGGYGDLPLMEDYALFARMLADGARRGQRGRAAGLLPGRRGTRSSGAAGPACCARSCGCSASSGAHGFTSPPEYVRNVLVRGGYRLIPWWCRRAVYRPVVAHFTERLEREAATRRRPPGRAEPRRRRTGPGVAGVGRRGRAGIPGDVRGRALA